MRSTFGVRARRPLFIEAGPITSACGESQSQQQLECNMRGQLMRSKIRKMEFNKLCWVKVGNCLRWWNEMGKRNPHVMWSDIYQTNSSDFSSHVHITYWCAVFRQERWTETLCCSRVRNVSWINSEGGVTKRSTCLNRDWQGHLFTHAQDHMVYRLSHLINVHFNDHLTERSPRQARLSQTLWYY